MRHDRFDELAEEWDDDPRKKARAQKVALAIVDRIDLQGAHVLEDGCGTGLLGFALDELATLATLTFIDPSEGMRAIVQRKVADRAPQRASVLGPLDDPGRGRDLVMSLMVLHHVPSPEEKIREWAQWLEPGGHLAIADLAPEDGSFHGHEIDDVHRGFDPAQIASWMRAAGLQPGEPTNVFEIEHDEDEVPRRYPVWLMLGRRPH